MNAMVEILNTAGRAFVGFAAPMLIQSSLLILILLAVDAVLRKRVRAVFRYWIWMLVLVKLVLPPSLWSPVSVGTWLGDKLEVSTTALLESPERPTLEEQGQDGLATRPPPAIADFLSRPQRIFVQPPSPDPAIAPPVESAPEPMSIGQETSLDDPPGLSQNWQGLVLLVWVTVVAALLLLLAQRTFFVQGLVAQANEASQAMLGELDQCRQHLGLRRPISMRLSPNAASPAVCGLRRPVILVPQNLASQLQGADLQAVLFHELAHVKRGDLWINLIQTLLQIVYFYNPLLWLANAAMRRIREKAVDETVLVAMGEAAPQYPQILVNVAKLALAQRPALSLRLIGVVESKSVLTSRIKHILNRPIPKTAKLGLLSFLVVITTGAILLPMAKAKSTASGAQEASAPLQEQQGINDEGAAGNAPVEREKAARTLELRPALAEADLEPGVMEECRKALAEGRTLTRDRYLWVPVRPGTDLPPLVVTQTHEGKTWLLVYSKGPLRMVPAQGWYPTRVDRRIDDNGRSTVTVGLDIMGAAWMSDVYTGKPLAQILDGVAVSAPIIRKGGGPPSVVIAGNFTEQELDDMLAALRKDVPKPPPSQPLRPTPPWSSAPLTPPQELSGRVVDPDGRPVAGAQVALSTNEIPLMLHNSVIEGGPDDARRRWIVETDAEGRFSLERRTSAPFDLIATHATGFALVAGGKFNENHEIRPQRWGRIEGQLAKGRGGPNNRVRMSGLPNPTWLGEQRDFRYDAQCDADGRFVFERVSAGWFEVGYPVATGDDSEDFTSRTPVAVKTGETARVKLGGEGRPVVGRFVPPAGYGKSVYFGAGVRHLQTHWPYPSGPDGDIAIERDQEQWRQPSPPSEVEAHSADANWPDLPKLPPVTASQNRSRWYSGWQPEAEAYFADAVWRVLNWRGYAFRINSDGSFRIQDVVPGKYDLTVGLEDDSPDPFGGYHATIEVPSMTQEHADQPLDLGTLTLDMLGVGDMAPLFKAQTLDGKPIRLIDYRGKFVLLSFWSPDCDTELDCLKELHKTYGDKGDFQIIGLSSSFWPERSVEEVKRYVAEHQIEWPEIYLGEQFPDGIAKQNHVLAIPWVLLVGPDGKIAATSLRGKRLMNTVREALERAPTPAPAPAPAPKAPSGVSGRVVDPNGKPVAGAQVALCAKDKGVDIRAGQLIPTKWGGKGSEIVKTDALGRFSFSSMPDEFHLIAAHNKGFAWVTNKELTTSGDLRLEPWGRIEGTLRIAREPGADKRVSLLNFINKNAVDQNVHYDYQTQTDASGRFSFEKVPPGWIEVGYMIRVGDSMWTDTSRTPIHLQPGQNMKMTLGGEGRPVIGKFVPPSDYQGPVYFGQGLRALATWRPEPPKPANYDQMTKREQQEWYNQWRKTPEAEAFYDAIWHDLSRRHYTFRIGKDGTFRIEDVIPGKYDFTVWLEERLTGQGRPEEIGAYYGTVEVPLMTATYTDEPLDLGNLTLGMHNPPLHVGDMAPLFEAKSLDGKDLRLIDYRGKFVLLSFWQPTFHPELDRLKELHQTYNRAGKLQIIDFAGSDTLGEVRSYIDQHKIEWPEIYLGENWDSDIAKQYGNPVASYILLVNPEGKIVATWLRGEKLTQTIKDALDKTN